MKKILIILTGVLLVCGEPVIAKNEITIASTIKVAKKTTKKAKKVVKKKAKKKVVKKKALKKTKYNYRYNVADIQHYMNVLIAEIIASQQTGVSGDLEPDRTGIGIAVPQDAAVGLDVKADRILEHFRQFAFGRRWDRTAPDVAAGQTARPAVFHKFETGGVVDDHHIRVVAVAAGHIDPDISRQTGDDRFAVKVIHDQFIAVTLLIIHFQTVLFAVETGGVCQRKVVIMGENEAGRQPVAVELTTPDKEVVVFGHIRRPQGFIPLHGALHAHDKIHLLHSAEDGGLVQQQRTEIFHTHTGVAIS